jgi:putative oxidoreductase
MSIDPTQHTWLYRPFSHAERVSAQWRDFLLLVARVMLGWIFVLSGWGKVLDVDRFIAGLERQNVPAATVLGYVGAISEFLGGLAILIGLSTRYAALLILLFTIVATLISHRYWEFTDPAAHRQQHTQFLKNLSIMGGTVLLFITGGGRFSIDGLLTRRRPD